MKTTIMLLMLVFLFGAVSVSAKPHDDTLPRGLRIQVAEGRQLPLGWEKTLQIGDKLEPEIYAHGRIVVPVDGRGNIIVLIKDRRVRLTQATLEIVELLN